MFFFVIIFVRVGVFSSLSLSFFKSIAIYWVLLPQVFFAQLILADMNKELKGLRLLSSLFSHFYYIWLLESRTTS